MSIPFASGGVIVLTGAGISAESGLGTFRDEDGIWTKYPLEDLATPEGFARNPEFVQSFYNARRAHLRTADVNAAHTALAKLEKALTAAGTPFTLVTQNVDNLHQRAGNSQVLPMHGELTKIRCMACGDVTYWPDDVTADTACPTCDAVGLMRPHVVWFGEMPLHMDEIERQLGRCSLFVSIGTSGNVYPAAGFVQMAKMSGAWTVELNLEPSEGARLFDEGQYGLASKIVPAWTETILEGL